MGYHKSKIKKGVLGEISKITEEYDEFIDASLQDSPVMELVELSDLLGAIDAYSTQTYNIGLDDLIKMTRSTQSAFREGERK